MTKAQLLEALKNVPDDTQLYVLCDEFGTYHPVTRIFKDPAAWYAVDGFEQIYDENGNKKEVVGTQEKELHTHSPHSSPLTTSGYHFLNTEDIWTIG